MATFTAVARRYSGLSIWPEQVRGTILDVWDVRMGLEYPP